MKKIVIIGGGIAGLSAGCYAKMNGYDAYIFEMHYLPRGLCTACKRKGYTFDICIQWLSDTRPYLLNIPRTLPKLKNFYMAGQWVGDSGLSTAAKSGRDIVQLIYKKHKKRFITNKPHN